MKFCTKCKSSKDFKEFFKDKTRKDGLYPTCKQCRKVNYEQNREKILLLKKRNNAKNIKKIKAYCLKNKEKRAKQNKQWYLDNRERNNQKRKNYRRDPKLRLIHNLRVRIKQAFLGKGKSRKTFDMLGTNLDNLKLFIENQFISGMSLDNYGKWEIDHKIPLSLAKTKEEVENLCHYSNLQPLWKSDNRKKGNRL